MPNVNPVKGTISSKFLQDKNGNVQMYATFWRNRNPDGTLTEWLWSGFVESTEQLGQAQMTCKTVAGQEDDVFYACMMPMLESKGDILKKNDSSSEPV